jgi:ATP-binding cassette subfamily F protein 3
MPVVLQLEDAHLRYGEQQLLAGANCALADDQKVGLIGHNGVGKSTLCRVLLGDETLDGGEVLRGKKLRLGYLRQHDPFEPGETVLEFWMRDSKQPDWRCGEVAWQFQFPDAMLDLPVRDLSGGWQTRTKLAALLLHNPNLLILDEPTNFLDLRTQMLLENFLRDFQGGCLIVSHDRTFLKKTCTHTLELSRGKLSMFPGDVEQYLKHVEERREHDLRVNAATLAKRRQLETFIAKNRANANTASQARNKAKQLERLELLDIAGAESSVQFSFPEIEPRQGPAARTIGLAIGYPDLEVAKDIHVEVEHGSLVGVVGDNGQGKTTFLRTLCGSLEPLEGDIKWGFGCQIGVYAQHVYTTLPEEKTVEDYLSYQSAAGTTQQQIKDIAGSVLFRGAMIQKRIKVLSGGERARLVIAGLLLEQHNVLVLDEPGNHLDVETVEALSNALKRYRGTVIFTSHDRHFMNCLATHVIEVGDGGVVSYPSSYDDYVYRVQKEIDAGLRADTVTSPTTLGNGNAQDQKARARSDRDAQKKLRALERRIQKLDAQKQELNDKLLTATAAKDAEQYHTELATVSTNLKQLEEQWLKLSGELELAE